MFPQRHGEDAGAARSLGPAIAAVRFSDPAAPAAVGARDCPPASDAGIPREHGPSEGVVLFAVRGSRVGDSRIRDSSYDAPEAPPPAAAPAPAPCEPPPLPAPPTATNVAKAAGSLALPSM